MSSESGDGNHAEAEAKHPAKENQWRYLSRENAIFAQEAIGAAAVVLGLGAAALFVHHVTAGYWATGAAIVAVLATLAIHIRHIRRRKRKIAWLLATPFALAELLCLIMVPLALFSITPMTIWRAIFPPPVLNQGSGIARINIGCYDAIFPAPGSEFGKKVPIVMMNPPAGSSAPPFNLISVYFKNRLLHLDIELMTPAHGIGFELKDEATRRGSRELFGTRFLGAAFPIPKLEISWGSG